MPKFQTAHQKYVYAVQMLDWWNHTPEGYLATLSPAARSKLMAFLIGCMLLVELGDPGEV